MSPADEPRTTTGGAEAVRGGPLARKINHLFETVRRSDGKPYSNEEVAEAITELGEATISGTYLWYLRRGDRDNPTKKHLEILARFFDVSPAYFFDDDRSRRIAGTSGPPAPRSGHAGAGLGHPGTGSGPYGDTERPARGGRGVPRQPGPQPVGTGPHPGDAHPDEPYPAAPGGQSSAQLGAPYLARPGRRPAGGPFPAAARGTGSYSGGSHPGAGGYAPPPRAGGQQPGAPYPAGDVPRPGGAHGPGGTHHPAGVTGPGGAHGTWLDDDGQWVADLLHGLSPRSLRAVAEVISRVRELEGLPPGHPGTPVD